MIERPVTTRGVQVLPNMSVPYVFHPSAMSIAVQPSRPVSSPRCSWKAIVDAIARETIDLGFGFSGQRTTTLEVRSMQSNNMLDCRKVQQLWRLRPFVVQMRCCS